MAIRWDKFTIKSQEAFQHASDLASQHGNPELLPVHMLVVLAQDREGIVVPVLSKLGTNPAVIEAQAMERVEALPKVSGSGATQAHLSSEMQKVLDQAFKEADKFKDEYVSTEHLLLAIAQNPNKDRNDAAQKLLTARGITHGAILKALAGIRGSQRVTDQNPEAKYQ